MHVNIGASVNPVVQRIHALLRKMDDLKLPTSSSRDVVSILVRQAGREIDRALPWQAGHGQRAATIAVRIGQTVGLDVDALHHLWLAALLHDIGLLMLPRSLAKSGTNLDLDSYAAIQSHSRLGATLLEPFSCLKEAAIIIAHHHERWDGSGYPYGIRGTYIPLGARILSIADAFDAIKVPDVSDPAVRNLIALRILKVASGTQFDPDLVAATVDIVLHRSSGKHHPASNETDWRTEVTS